MLGASTGVVRFVTHHMSPMRTTAVVTMPPQIQATGGRDWVRTTRSSAPDASWRIAAVEVWPAEGFTPNRAWLKSGVAIFFAGTAPDAAASSSSRNSGAVWNRSNLSFASERMTMASSAGDTAGLMLDGFGGASLMCW